MKPKTIAVVLSLAAALLAGPAFANGLTSSDQTSTMSIERSPEAPRDADHSSQDGHRAALLITAPGSETDTETLIGSVVWSTTRTGSGRPQAEATIDVPDAGLTLRFEIRRTADDHQPESATIDLRFEEGRDNVLGPVKRIKVPLLRRETEGTGQTLSGALVAESDNVFTVALSTGEAEQTNRTLIATRGWIDVPMLFASGRVAKITFEEGANGRELLNDVLRP